MALKLPDSWFNFALAKEPMNWAIAFVIASVWLLLFHVVMTAWNAMIAPTTQPAFVAPGMVAAPTAAVGDFATAGSQGGMYPTDTSSNFWGGGMGLGDGVWTDGFESKWSEDGWTGNS